MVVATLRHGAHSAPPSHEGTHPTLTIVRVVASLRATKGNEKHGSQPER